MRVVLMWPLVFWMGWWRLSQALADFGAWNYNRLRRYWPEEGRDA